MAAGSVQTVLVCVPSQFSQAPCPAGTAITVAKAYLIDESQASSVEAQNAPFDYAYASGLWGMGFSFVVGLFLVSKSAGTILNMIRR